VESYCDRLASRLADEGADGQIRPHSLSLRELESVVERSASSRSGVPAAGLGIQCRRRPKRGGGVSQV
jgi:hypothetical protein